MNNEVGASVFLIFVGIYVVTFGLLEFMVWRVNKQLPVGERLSYGLPGARLRVEYTRLFPKSQLYATTMKLSATLVIVAIVFAGWRVWEYISN